jgi:hypothetical protein
MSVPGRTVPTVTRTLLLAVRPVPSTADWWTAAASIVAAVGTVAAVVAALWLAVRDGRRREAEQRVRDAERRDAEARQARLVSADAGQEEHGSRVRFLNGPPEPPSNVPQVSFSVHNDSTEPVRDVTGVLFRHFPADSQGTATPEPATATWCSARPTTLRGCFQHHRTNGRRNPRTRSNWSSPTPRACAGAGAAPHRRPG